MLKKIENERRKAEELQRVRQDYDQMMREIKHASMERENARQEYLEKNSNVKSLNKMFI